MNPGEVFPNKMFWRQFKMSFLNSFNLMLTCSQTASCRFTYCFIPNAFSWLCISKVLAPQLNASLSQIPFFTVSKIVDVHTIFIVFQWKKPIFSLSSSFPFSRVPYIMVPFLFVPLRKWSEKELCPRIMSQIHLKKSCIILWISVTFSKLGII